MKKLLLLLVCVLVLTVPAMAQTQGPELELSWSQIFGQPVVPHPGEGVVILISTPADIQLWAHVIWPDQTGKEFVAEQVSMHYWIWREDLKSAEGSFVISQDLQPNDSFTVCNWFEWAKIQTNKPHCTYFKVQADLKIKGVDDPLMSNQLTFHLVPEPGALGVLATGLTGLLGFALRRRK